jgi:hypothetical protein
VLLDEGEQILPRIVIERGQGQLMGTGGIHGYRLRATI